MIGPAVTALLVSRFKAELKLEKEHLSRRIVCSRGIETMKDREAMRQHDAMIAKLEAALAELETPSL